MSIEKGRAYFRALGMEDRVQEFTVSSATVELAALALGVDGARIAKTLSFKTENGCNLFDDTWIGMPQNPGSPGTYIVDHFISIHIGNMGTFCTLNKTRRTPYSLVRTYRAVHASRKPEFCSHIK